MKNSKQIIIIIAVLIAGIFIGSTFFSKDSKEHDHQKETPQSTMWTCSMHPQIMQPESGQCPICGMDLIPAETSSSSTLDPDQFTLSENAMALANIETSMVKTTSSISKTLTLSGKVEANETAISTQTAHFSGRIEKLYVNFTGENISKGQLLALIYSPELVTAQKELLEAVKMKSSQPEVYEAVRNKLKLWKLSEKEITAIENAQEVRSNFPIYADASGIVTARKVAVGDYVKPGGALYEVTNLRTVWAVFDIYERDLKHLKVGQQLVVTSQAYPNKQFKAKITFIDPVLNPKTRTISVRAELSNKKKLLKPSMLLSSALNMKSDTKNSIVIIPKSAVLWTGKRSVVYVKIPNQEEPVFEMRHVMLGASTNGNYEIESGLLEGEEIVTNGTFTVDATAQLQGKKSMMNTAGGKSNIGHQHGESTIARSPSKTDEKIIISKKEKAAIHPLYNKYLLIKEALANDDFEKSKREVAALKMSLHEVKMNVFSSKTHDIWMSHSGNIENILKLMEKSSNIKNVRKHFKLLSDQFVELTKVFGKSDNALYIQFCPMANNSKGASWISDEKEIRNPYFGASMLKCGEITQEIE